MDGAVRWVRPAACRLVGVRQRAGAGGWPRGCCPACLYAGGQGPAARRVRPRDELVLLPILPLAGRRRFPGAVLVLIVASGLAGAALALPPFFLGPAILVAVYSVVAYGSQC